ncbi:uncharacterized protein LOC111098587 isoform X1 [Canis lupus familiaris]|uniref:uncharacterized protein LOC111098587 isoform X1 n=1 Tax=Canis lupus familiaris TaxID=9615 RepID=UPI0018F6F880|nr:uncharacterized protein LOC111098587 isoform X1 [Canis lupus familiaris]
MPRGSGAGAARGGLHLEAAQGPGPCPAWRRARGFASCKAGPAGSGYCEVRAALLLALSALALPWPGGHGPFLCWANAAVQAPAPSSALRPGLAGFPAARVGHAPPPWLSASGCYCRQARFTQGPVHPPERSAQGLGVPQAGCGAGSLAGPASCVGLEFGMEQQEFAGSKASPKALQRHLSSLAAAESGDPPWAPVTGSTQSVPVHICLLRVCSAQRLGEPARDLCSLPGLGLSARFLVKATFPRPQDVKGQGPGPWSPPSTRTGCPSGWGESSGSSHPAVPLCHPHQLHPSHVPAVASHDLGSQPWGTRCCWEEFAGSVPPRSSSPDASGEVLTGRCAAATVSVACGEAPGAAPHVLHLVSPRAQARVSVASPGFPPSRSCQGPGLLLLPPASPLLVRPLPAACGPPQSGLRSEGSLGVLFLEKTRTQHTLCVLEASTGPGPREVLSKHLNAFLFDFLKNYLFKILFIYL